MLIYLRPMQKTYEKDEKKKKRMHGKASDNFFNLRVAELVQFYIELILNKYEKK